MDYKAEWRKNMRARAIALLGGKCSECGSTERLEFDHIDAATKVQDVSAMIRDGASWERIVEELAKCQLLCKPHNLAKAKAKGETAGGRNKVLEPEHGTQVMYAQPISCRCELCREWKRQYRKGLVNSRGMPVA